MDEWDEPIRPSLATCLQCGDSWDEPFETHPRNGCKVGPPIYSRTAFDPDDGFPYPL